MKSSFMQECLESPQLINFIGYHAHKLSTAFSFAVDRADAEQELWGAVVVASKGYTGEYSVLDAARWKVYSHYGHLVEKFDRRKELRSALVSVEPPEAVENHPTTDRAYALIEARDTLDSIQRVLDEESKKSKQCQVVADSFKLMREGLSIGEAADHLGISRNLLYVRRNQYLKKALRESGLT